MGAEFGGGWIQAYLWPGPTAVHLNYHNTLDQLCQYTIKVKIKIFKTLKGKQTGHGHAWEIGSWGREGRKDEPMTWAMGWMEETWRSLLSEGWECGGQRPRARLGWTGLYWDSTRIIVAITAGSSRASPLLQRLSTKTMYRISPGWRVRDSMFIQEGMLSHS